MSRSDSQSSGITRSTIIDLDDRGLRPWILLVAFDGQKTAIDASRLERLLQLESRAEPAATASPAEAEPAGRIGLKNRQIPAAAVSHASLSTRITKVYNYSKASEILRPAHAGLLSEVLLSFDWAIPQHPNTRLVQQLQEMLGWQGMTADLKAQIEDFLKRYSSVRNSA